MQPFLPAHLTPLFYTPCYATLSDAQRLRYNQLQGLYFNEQIAFFESGFACNLLAAFRADPALQHLADALREFAAEEQRHTAMFRGWNRTVAPDLYATRHHYFVRVGRGWAFLLNQATKQPRLFPMFVWLMLLQEERSLYYAREILQHRDALESGFVALHRAHLADEVDHVRWDEALLDELWGRASPRRRQANAAVCEWMIAEFFNTPKRAQVRVVEELARDYPELRGQLPDLCRQLRALERDQRYQASLYSRSIVPRTLARFDEWSEFRKLVRRLTGCLESSSAGSKDASLVGPEQHPHPDPLPQTARERGPEILPRPLAREAGPAPAGPGDGENS